MEQSKDKCSIVGGENAFFHIDVCKNDAIMRGELELVDLVLNHQTLDIGKSDERVNQLFSELDLNEDGHITKEVWLSNWQKICCVMPGLKGDPSLRHRRRLHLLQQAALRQARQQMSR